LGKGRLLHHATPTGGPRKRLIALLRRNEKREGKRDGSDSPCHTRSAREKGQIRSVPTIDRGKERGDTIAQGRGVSFHYMIGEV